MLSEHDWQATVLAELGIPRSGLVTPDPSGASAPTGREKALAAEESQPIPPRAEQPQPRPQPEPQPPYEPQPEPEPPYQSQPSSPQPQQEAPYQYQPEPQPEPPYQPQSEPAPPYQPQPEPEPEPLYQSQPSPPQPQQEPPYQYQPQPEPQPEFQPQSQVQPPLQPRPQAPEATYWDQPTDRRGAEPPSAQVRSAPAPPEEQVEQVADWSPPAWDAPPPESTPDPSPQPHPSPYSSPGPPPQEEAVPNPATAWELASQTSWGLVAQAPWGTEPPPEAEPAQQTWERSEAGQPPPAAPPAAPPGRPPAPRPAPQDLVRRSAYGDPLMRRVGRGVRRAVGAAAADEIRRTADVEQVLTQPVPSSRRIAVTSIRGGAGKTTVAGLTATVIAQYRQDRVLAVDADSGLGSLPLRLGVRTERSLHDLTSAGPRTFEEAAAYLGRTADGLWVLSGTAGGRITRELDLATFKAAAGVMTRYFSALVIDCGAGLLPELQRGILADAHAQIMVTPGTVDGALSAQGALEWQARNGYAHLLSRTVVAFVTHTPHVDADLTRGAQLLSGGGMPVVHMPYDRHLATGTAVESARIGQETRAAAIRVALEAFARAAGA